MYGNKKVILDIFANFTEENGLRWVERSNLVSKYFKGEFNLSGGHAHLIPALHSCEELPIKRIGTIDNVIRKTDAEIIGISKSHLLNFNMGVFGSFGYIDDKKQEEYQHMKMMFDFLDKCGIDKKRLLFTICAGGQYSDKNILPDNVSRDILLSFGIHEDRIIKTKARRNFMFSRGIDRLAGYNIEVFVAKDDDFIEIASANLYEYLNKETHLEKTINSGMGVGFGMERLEYLTQGLDCVYDLEFYQNVKDKIAEAEKFGIASMKLVQDKIYRITELAKTIVRAMHDGCQLGDKTPHSKTLKAYIAKTISELEFLGIQPERFIEIVKSEMERRHDNKYLKFNIDDGIYNTFINALTQKDAPASPKREREGESWAERKIGRARKRGLFDSLKIL